MTVAPTIWNPHGKVYADPALEKSVLVVFVEFCSDMAIGVADARSISNWRGTKTSIFHLTNIASAGIAHAMGIEPEQWDQLRGVDLLAGRIAKQVFVGELRYCPSCLTRGNHSTLFQLPQVARCPVHQEWLRMGCSHCGSPISSSAMSLAKNHLYCGSCDRNLATSRRRMTLGGAVDHPSAERFAALRRAVKAELAPGELRSRLQWNKAPRDIAASLDLVKLFHAHAVWGDPLSSEGSLMIKTESFRLDAEGPLLDRRKFYASIRSTAINAFEELATLLGQHVELMEMPPAVENAMSNGARIDLKVSAIVAAFWQAAAAFEVHRFLLGELPPWAATSAPFLSWLPEHTEAMRILVRQAVLELFVRSLVMMRRLQYGVQVAWSQLPDEPWFLLPWRLRPVDSNTLELNMRPRVDLAAVERLVSRYRRHWLLDAPEGVPLLDLVRPRVPRATADASQQGEDRLALWAWPFTGE